METSMIMAPFRANSKIKYKLESLHHHKSIRLVPYATHVPFMPVRLKDMNSVHAKYATYCDKSENGQSRDDHVEPFVEFVMHYTACNRFYPIHSFNVPWQCLFIEESCPGVTCYQGCFKISFTNAFSANWSCKW